MTEKISTNEPSLLWEFFEQICLIPRPSKKEDKILEYLVDIAKSNNLDFEQDKAGNLLIRKKASPGKEHIRTVALQCHVDMVGEKEININHNFDTDPIHPIIKQGWVTANGTTLGADDGIGMAAILVLLADDQITHGPLECLFTVDEESGMTGAVKMKPGFFESKILLNLDSEDEGQLFIGCAGGIDTLARFKLRTKAVKQKMKSYLVQVTGLKGGHSGDEIHKSPVNSIKLLNRLLWNASKEYNLAISRFEGGNFRNAIPRDAEALVLLPLENVQSFKSFFHIFACTVKKEIKQVEPGLRFNLAEADPPTSVISRKLQQRLLNAIYACPHGVIKWSKDIEGLVETSTNLASVKFVNEKEILITTSQRSSVDSARKDVSDTVGSIFALAGANVEHANKYPGWIPDPDSEILKLTIASYRKLFKKNPVVRAIHAGLECGLLLEKYPDLNMISFGPTIKGAHTPFEKINIKSTQKFLKLLIEVLQNIPEA